MEYLLAKELKDAGFPQERGNAYEIDAANQYAFEKLGIKADLGRTKIPTLEELIEACGEEFGILHQLPNNRWIAVGRNRRRMLLKSNYEESFATAEETIARFWLAMNKK